MKNIFQLHMQSCNAEKDTASKAYHVRGASASARL